MVFVDSPINQAVEGIVQGIFSNQGHVCCAGSRLLVQESVHDEVIASLQRRIGTLRLGDPLDKNTDIGSINSAAKLARIRELSDVGVAEGASRWQPACELPERGYWFPPTVFTDVSPAHRIARDEIFGPVLSVLTFRTPDEAVAKANNTLYGLSAGIWSEKGSRVMAADRPPPWLAVRKTYKLYLGGAFPRSESGRTYEVTDARGHFLANAAEASRKDARDAVA